MSCLGEEGGPADDAGLVVGEDATGPLASGRVIAIEQATPSVKVFWIETRLHQQEATTVDNQPTCVLEAHRLASGVLSLGPCILEYDRGIDTPKIFQNDLYHVL